MKHVIETFKSAFGGRFVLVMMGFVPAIYLFFVFFTGGIDAYKLFTFIIAPLIFCLFCVYMLQNGVIKNNAGNV